MFWLFVFLLFILTSEVISGCVWELFSSAKDNPVNRIRLLRRAQATLFTVISGMLISFLFFGIDGLTESSPNWSLVLTLVVSILGAMIDCFFTSNTLLGAKTAMSTRLGMNDNAKGIQLILPEVIKRIILGAFIRQAVFGLLFMLFFVTIVVFGVLINPV